MSFFRPCLFILTLVVLSGCDIKGANEPYSKAPMTSHSVWLPPRRAKTVVNMEQLNQDLKEYEAFSEECPISLAELIDIALHRSPMTKESWANARISAANYGKSLQKEFVLADIDGFYSRSRFADFLGNKREIVYETQYGADLQLSYTILDFGQTRFTSEAALQSLYNADWSHNSTIQSTLQTVMTDYHQYLYQKALLVAAEQDIANAKVSLESTQEKFRSGLADVSDVVQAKTSYLQTELTILTNQKSLESAYTKLMRDMGLPSTGTLHFQSYPHTTKSFDIETIDDLIIKANNHRPDLFAAESNTKASLAKLKAAKAKQYPVITGEFDIGRKYFQKGLNDTYDFKGQVSFSFPLFQGFLIENTIKAARAEVEKAEAELEQAKLKVVQEVANDRTQVILAREALTYADNYLQAAEEDYKVNLKKYQVGTGNIVALINAQTNVADARAKFAKTQYEWYESITNLAYSTGVLLPPQTQENSHENESSIY